VCVGGSTRGGSSGDNGSAALLLKLLDLTAGDRAAAVALGIAAHASDGRGMQHVQDLARDARRRCTVSVFAVV
jgi:hypothetical protein